MDQSKIKPALISGVIFGVISCIPIVSMLNCCCGWLLICGVVAVKMYSNNIPNNVSYSDGVVVGGLSGFIAGIISQMVGMIFNVIRFRNFSAEEVKEAIRREVEKNPAASDPKAVELIMQWADLIASNIVVFLFLAMILVTVIMAVFGALGGLAGASVFKKKDKPPTTPPYDYGQSFGEGPKTSYPQN